MCSSDLLAGQYRIIVRTDIFNQVYESADEGNNLRSSAEPIAIEVPELTLGVALDTALVSDVAPINGMIRRALAVVDADRGA